SLAEPCSRSKSSQSKPAPAQISAATAEPVFRKHPTRSSPARNRSRNVTRGSVVEALEGVAVALVLCAALLHFGQPRDLGGRDVPPDSRVREIPVRVALAVDHPCALLGSPLGARRSGRYRCCP